MTRWGPRLFECAQDLEIATDLTRSFGFNTINWPYTLTEMVNQSDPRASPGSRTLYQTAEYARNLENIIIPSIRARLDTDGFGSSLFDATCESKTSQSARYRTVILGALLMRAGARIRAHDLAHLRVLATSVSFSARSMASERGMDWDLGFRAPGRVQFLAAVDNYRVGVPRRFLDESCYNCSLTEADIGHPLLPCLGCESAWYCNPTCERLYRPDHQPDYDPLEIGVVGEAETGYQ